MGQPLDRPDHRTGILLLAHGGPDSLTDIEPFLRNIRGGRGFSPKLLEEITDRYRQIGGRSPLLEISRRQAAALERELAGTGGSPRVYLGMRNWHPFIRDAVEEIKRDGITHLLAMCLAPQNSRMSVGLYFQYLKDAETAAGLDIPITFIESWHDEPLLIEAFADRLQLATAGFPSSGAPASVLLTAHSLPEKILSDGDPYDRQTHETAAAVAARCGIADWRFAYQSQGATSDTWMGPTVESTIEDLARLGCRHLVIAPIGFLSDHIEILYDIDILFRQVAARFGIEIRRPASLNDSPKLIAAMAGVVRRHLPEERK